MVTVAISNVAGILEENVMLDDLLGRSETAYVKMIEQEYRAEQDLADRYRSFVTEILRLSLAGLAVFSFIYKQGSSLPTKIYDLAAKDVAALLGVGLFSLSVVFALWFLFSASEGLRWYIAGLRYRSHLQGAQPAEGQAASGNESSTNDYLAERNKWIVRCRWTKLLAASTLALGGICMALAIIPLKL